MPTQQLFELCASLFDGISASEAQSRFVDKITRAQSVRKKWDQFQAGRVTAYRMEAVCSNPLEHSSMSLMNPIGYPHTTKF